MTHITDGASCMHRLDGGGSGIFLKGFVSLLSILCWLAPHCHSVWIHTLTFWCSTSAPPLHSTLLEILQATKHFLFRAFHMSVPSTCHAVLPTLLLKLLLLLKALFIYCSFLGVCASPRLAHLPRFLSRDQPSPSIPSFHCAVGQAPL